MKHNSKNLGLWHECMLAVYERASGVCEIMIDGKRCPMHLPLEDVGYINFAHTKSRNFLTDEQVVDPDYVLLTCTCHHVVEHTQGGELVGVEYEEGELTYVPDEQ
ncbi:MAG TPA: hypothetical protein ENI08_02205 [Candidatus Dependentiae bacterium]|nr:hypothetical protein [Candidatus Dependentiae bacterium]